MIDSIAYKRLRIKDNPEDYNMVHIADKTFLSCIMFEVIGIMTMMFLGAVGAEMMIYLMTFLYSFFICRKHKDSIHVPIGKIEAGKTFHALGMAVCGVPVAMLLNALGCMFSNSGAEMSEDVNIYPVGLAVIVFAIVPAIVEEYIFRGAILGAYMNVDVKASILISSIFFALLHFSLGSVLYGFLFGCLFAYVRIVTGNMLYSIIMHCAFNSVNVLLSYANIENVPVWTALLLLGIGLIGFVVLTVAFFKAHGTEMSMNRNKGKYKPYEMIAKEGYIAVGICVFVICMLGISG